MNKWTRFSLIGVLLLGMILLRLNQKELFYDPLLDYFKNKSQDTIFQTFNVSKHLISVSFRYLLNGLLSIGIIYMLFEKKKYIYVSMVVLFIGWIIFLPIYYSFIETEFEYSLMLGFYVRRFMIQPIIGIVLILALFYLEKMKK